MNDRMVKLELIKAVLNSGITGDVETVIQNTQRLYDWLTPNDGVAQPHLPPNAGWMPATTSKGGQIVRDGEPLSEVWEAMGLVARKQNGR